VNGLLSDSQFFGRGQHHEDYTSQCRVVLNLLSQCESVDLRQLSIQQNQRKRTTAILSDLKRLTANIARITLKNFNFWARDPCSELLQDFRHGCTTGISQCK
jgi:hypothetical protein